MFKNPKQILAYFLAAVGFFISSTSYADSVMLNKEVAESSHFYEEEDDLKHILQQPLFITDINYTLRKDDEVKLTVNTVKYQDKMIQRLVNLIR